jgi:hypothetical protein
VATFDTDHFVAGDSNQSIAVSIQKLLDSAVQLVSTAGYTVDVSGETISLRLAVDFVHVTYIKDKQMLVSNFLFDLSWTGGGSSVGNVAYLRPIHT